jgi:ABC-type dipeptide/oligopeptide/nickel transport system permease subunit
MKRFGAGTILLFVLIFAGIAAPILSPHDPHKQVLSLSFHGPSISSPMGRDALGRDIFSRVLYGIRTSMFIGFTVVCISLLVGVTIGGMAGYIGGFTDTVFARVIDILMAFPGLLLSIGIAGIMGPSTVNIIIALCAVGWVGYARYTRAMVMSVKQRDYILSAKAAGKNRFAILFADILPNILEPLIVEASFGIGIAIVSEASLSFLGLSSPSTPSLGRMLSEAISVINVLPWMAIFPGLTLTIIVLLFNDIGEGLRRIYER